MPRVTQCIPVMESLDLCRHIHHSHKAIAWDIYLRLYIISIISKDGTMYLRYDIDYRYCCDQIISMPLHYCSSSFSQVHPAIIFSGPLLYGTSVTSWKLYNCTIIRSNVYTSSVRTFQHTILNLVIFLRHRSFETYMYFFNVILSFFSLRVIIILGILIINYLSPQTQKQLIHAPSSGSQPSVCAEEESSTLARAGNGRGGTRLRSQFTWTGIYYKTQCSFLQWVCTFVNRKCWL